MTFKTFFDILWDRSSSLSDTYGFRGAYISGNFLRGEDEFPMTRTRDEWEQSYDSWRTLAKGYGLY